MFSLLMKLLIAISRICHYSNPRRIDAIANLLIRLYIEAISRLAIISAKNSIIWNINSFLKNINQEVATDIHAPLVEDESASPDISGPTMESISMRVVVNAITTLHVVITIHPRNSSTTIRSWQIITQLIIIRQINHQ